MNWPRHSSTLVNPIFMRLYLYAWFFKIFKWWFAEVSLQNQSLLVPHSEFLVGKQVAQERFSSFWFFLPFFKARKWILATTVKIARISTSTPHFSRWKIFPISNGGRGGNNILYLHSESVIITQYILPMCVSVMNQSRTTASMHWLCSMRKSVRWPPF